ncbi:DUF6192 family protein [Actinomadura rudentiformis]|uniref:RacO protein n=1 Tax=Actinomadura rudentiformis TaxID=359158 RepID=A0A6H9YIJ9_9ACTN|nr:DUF6192 family protein [Actinomadura rudentiformis]KAB2340549.1 RacO protein [Actinomadura rudentiformis]
MSVEMVGHVTRARYEELVREARELVELQTRCQWGLGDKALEIEPLQRHGGQGHGPVENMAGVNELLQMFADDVGAALNTIRNYRWVSSRWPAQRRRKGVSHYVHAILASIPDEAERWEAIDNPPLDERTGTCRWTEKTAHKRVGQQTREPTTVAQKVAAIHDLAADEQVASQITTDLLRRPAVAREAMRDTTARHLVNRAQVEHDHAAGERTRQIVQPARERIQHTTGFIDLIAACSTFVAAGGRIVPNLSGRPFTDDERAAIHRNVARVRAMADWIEGAADTGNTSLDAGLAALLRGDADS